MNLIHTHVILHYDARRHTLQAPVIEPGFEANKIINNFIHWKLKENNDYFRYNTLAMLKCLFSALSSNVNSH